MENNQVKKNILVFSTAYLPLVGGAEIAVKEITDRLLNWQFDMITAKIQFGLPEFEKIGNINVYRIGFGCNFDKFLLPVWGLLKAIRLNKKNHYNLTWSIMASQASVATSFFKIFNSSKKLLLTLQEGDLETHLERYVFGNKFLYKLLIKPWHLLCFKQADYFTSISSSLRQRAIKNSVNSEIIKIVPNGVDEKKFATELIQEHVHEQKVILTVSRLVHKNGVDDLIKAGQYLNFDFKMLIIGSGQDEKKLKKLTKKLRLENKVLFLGNINNDDVPKYLLASDIFCRPSLSEGLGISFLEAMSCGLPIIGTPVGGILDFLEDRKTGLFCKVRNPQDIAEKIKEILKDDNLRKSIAKEGLKLIREKYTWDSVAKRMEEIFIKLS